MIHWIMGLVGIIMMGFSYLYLDLSSTFGTTIGIVGLVFVGSPFYVIYKLKKFASEGKGEGK